MSEFAMRVKEYYERGLWTAERVRKAMEKGKLTSEEYAAITGKEYNG